MRRARVLVGSLLVLVILAGAAIAFVAWREREARVWTDGGTIREQAKHVSPRDVLWTPPRALDAPINTDTDEYEPRISGNGQRLFFVRGRAALNADLYVAERTKDGWGEPVALEGLNTSDFDELGPCPSWDGNVLHFASNRDGGEGGYDLWRTQRQDDGTWSAPVNLGPSINSPHDEYGATLAPDQVTLVFSSNRPNATREAETTDDGEPTWAATLRTNIDRAPFDLYSITVGEEGAAASAIDALYSSADEGAPVFSPAGDFIYFASNRADGAGGFDLYRARIREGGFDEPESLGAPINTQWNELDPALWHDGFALVFSREMVVGPERERTYDLFESESREVYSERDASLAAIDWARWLPALWWLLLLLTLLALLLFLWRQLHNKRLSLLVRCLLASALLHCLLLLLLSVWQVTTGLSDLWNKGRETKVALTAGASEGSIAEQVRGAMRTPVELPMLAVTSERPATPAMSTPASAPAPERAEMTPVESPSVVVRSQPIEVAPAEAQPTPNERPEREVALKPIESTAIKIETLAGPSAQPIETVAEESVEVRTVEARDASPAPRAEQRVSEAETSSPLVETAVADDPSAEPVTESETTAHAEPVQSSRSATSSARPDVSEDLPPMEDPILLVAGGEEPMPLPAEEARVTENEAEPDLDSQIVTPNAVDDAPSRAITHDTTDDSPANAPRLESEMSYRTPEAVTSEAQAAAAPSESAAPEVSSPAREARPDIDTLDETPLELAATDLSLPTEESAVQPTEEAEAQAIVVEAPVADDRELRADTATATDDEAPAPLVELAMETDEPSPIAPDRAATETATDAVRDANPETSERAARESPDTALTLDSPELIDVVAIPSEALAGREPDEMPNALEPTVTAPDAPVVSGAHEHPLDAMTELDRPATVVLAPDASHDAPTLETDAALTETDPEAPTDIALSEAPDRAVDETEFALDAPLLADILLPSETVAAYTEREAPNRLELVKERGGSEATERAVALALGWLAEHQHDDGRWSTQHFDDDCRECRGAGRYQTDVATTGLSLLAFLGAGHTHFKEGEYRDRVERAIDWLRARQRPNGDLRAGETMYSHGIAAIALSEAYGMTRDETLKPVVERAIRFILEARHGDSGGWRYEPGQFGDTSVFGWQVMAIISAKRAGIAIPDDAVAHGRRWLDQVSREEHRGRYGYQPGQPFSPAMTAEGMYCQQLLGRMKDEPRMVESAEYLIENPPVWDRQASTYYWYYATLALYQHGGEQWSTWNDQMTTTLLDNQRTDGRAAGSWDPVDRWAVIGGRVYQTALAALMLEVYYRYLPLYDLTALDE